MKCDPTLLREIKLKAGKTKQERLAFVTKCAAFADELGKAIKDNNGLLSLKVSPGGECLLCGIDDPAAAARYEPERQRMGPGRDQRLGADCWAPAAGVHRRQSEPHPD